MRLRRRTKDRAAEELRAVWAGWLVKDAVYVRAGKLADEARVREELRRYEAKAGRLPHRYGAADAVRDLEAISEQDDGIEYDVRAVMILLRLIDDSAVETAFLRARRWRDLMR